MLISKKENKLKKNTTISAKTKILKVELKKKNILTPWRCR
jgi:hypothetical protein